MKDWKHIELPSTLDIAFYTCITKLQASTTQVSYMNESAKNLFFNLYIFNINLQFLQQKNISNVNIFPASVSVPDFLPAHSA